METNIQLTEAVRCLKCILAGKDPAKLVLNNVENMLVQKLLDIIRQGVFWERGVAKSLTHFEQQAIEMVWPLLYEQELCPDSEVKIHQTVLAAFEITKKITRTSRNDDMLSRLTNREQEVLIYIAQGFSNKEIASHIMIGVRTVETHRERIMKKLDIHSIAGLTRFAIGKALIALEDGPSKPVAMTST